MKTVYRLEYKEQADNKHSMRGERFPNIGLGAYQSSVANTGVYLSDAVASAGMWNDPQHPTPGHEELLEAYWSHDYCCCFGTLAQLHEWFSLLDTNPAFNDVGCIAVYTVPYSYTHTGEFQSIACMEHMTFVHTLQICDTLN